MENSDRTGRCREVQLRTSTAVEVMASWTKQKPASFWETFWKFGWRRRHIRFGMICEEVRKTPPRTSLDPHDFPSNSPSKKPGDSSSRLVTRLPPSHRGRRSSSRVRPGPRRVLAGLAVEASGEGGALPILCGGRSLQPPREGLEATASGVGTGRRGRLDRSSHRKEGEASGGWRRCLEDAGG